MTGSTLQCTRCGEEKTPLERAPFRSELGERIVAAICPDCWQEWLKHQTLLINHYGLDPRDAESRKFLYEQIETVLLGGGEGKEVDTSRKGSVAW